VEGVGRLIGSGRVGDPLDDLVCRACGARDLELILSLGEQPLANALRPVDAADAGESRFPLDVAFCRTCSLVQLTVSVPPHVLFQEYPYFSSYSDTVVANARELVDRLVQELALGTTDLAVEIASNDGYLLRRYRHHGVPVLGIDPAENVARVAVANGVPTRCEYFGEALAEELRDAGFRASVLHANNVLAHVPDVTAVVRGMARTLRAHGHVVIETPYVRDLVDRIEFDTIYHEHLFYYSATALSRLLSANGLDLVAVERIPIHGGSLRVFAQLRGVAAPDKSVDAILREEARVGLDTARYYCDFGARVDALLDELRALLDRLRAEGRRIAGYGAAAKATVLLNALGVGAETIEFVADRNPHKHGRLIPGTRIPIVPAERLVEERPDDTVLFSWNFADEVLAQQAAYRAAGGRFVIPIPVPRLV
jgi:SAM-dependent methyltransferase